MTLTDAIREASTGHEISFLLTSYVEAVRYCDKLCNLPAQMRELPFRGTEDLKARVEALKLRFGEPSAMPDNKEFLIIKEALETFGAALDRTYLLTGCGNAPATDNGRLNQAASEKALAAV